MIRIVFLLVFYMLVQIQDISGQVLVDQVQTNFSGIKKLSVRGFFCMVDIQRGRSSDIWLDGEIRAARRTDDIRIMFNQVDSLLEVWIEQPKRETGLIKGYLLFDLPESVEIKVETISGNIMVHNSGNRVTELTSVLGSIEAFKVSGDINVKTISGSIDVSEIYGSADLSSVTGSIKMTGIRKGALASSASGTVAFSDVRAGVIVKTVSGKITADKSFGNVNLTTAAADIDMKEITGTFCVNSSSGSVRGSDIFLTGDSLFKTISGNMDILIGNKRDELTFDLQTSTGKLVLHDNLMGNQVRAGTGDLLIKGISMLGNLVYR